LVNSVIFPFIEVDLRSFAPDELELASFEGVDEDERFILWFNDKVKFEFDFVFETEV
jgi:hypothetical protein